MTKFSAKPMVDVYSTSVHWFGNVLRIFFIILGHHFLYFVPFSLVFLLLLIAICLPPPLLLFLQLILLPFFPRLSSSTSSSPHPHDSALATLPLSPSLSS